MPWPAHPSSRCPQASLLLPLLLAVLVFGLLSPATVAADSRFSPYLQRFADGWIDWDQGLIYGIGKGYLHLNGNSRVRAMGAARVIASGNIVKLASGIKFDDRQTLKSLGSGYLSVSLKAFLRDQSHSEEFIKEADEPYIEVVRVAHIRGIQGLTAKVLDHLKGTEWQPLEILPLDQQRPQDEDPLLILDARPLGPKGVEPALFPKVRSASGELIYAHNKVANEALIDSGMARYVISAASRDELRADASDPRFIAWLEKLLSPDEAIAGETKKRKKRGRYIVSEVTKSEGLYKTNLVISDSDAKKIQQANSASQILKKCRVVIIVSSSVGGIEGRLQTLFARADTPRP